MTTVLSSFSRIERLQPFLRSAALRLDGDVLAELDVVRQIARRALECAWMNGAEPEGEMEKQRTIKLTRRQMLAGTAAALGASNFPAPAVGQGPTSIKMTLPWLPQGSQLFAFVARNRGFWQRRGLNVEIARGFGSGAAIQTITQKQMQTGIIAAPSVIVAAAQNLDTRVVGIAGYNSTMGVLVLADSPIKTIKDMEGRKLGSTLQSAEVPFIDHYLTLSGVDPTKVARVALQANVLDTSLINKQVDAISVFATSNMPGLLSQGVNSASSRTPRSASASTPIA